MVSFLRSEYWCAKFNSALCQHRPSTNVLMKPGMRSRNVKTAVAPQSSFKEAVRFPPPPPSTYSTIPPSSSISVNPPSSGVDTLV